MKRILDHAGLLGEGNPLSRFPSLREAALDVFSRKGYKEASLNDIIVKAGMSKGSFYHHFGDKFGLYVSMTDFLIQKKAAFFTPILQENRDSGDFFGLFRHVVQATVEFMLADRRTHEILNRFLEESAEFQNRMFAIFKYDFSRGFGPLIRSAIRSGQIDGRFSEEFLSRVLEVLLTNTHKFLKYDTSAQGVVALINQLVDLIQFGAAAEKEEKHA